MASLPRSLMMCATAWEAVVTSQYALCCEYEHWTGESGYTISSSSWLKCAQSGCLWCLLLAKHFLKDLRERTSEWPTEKVHVQVSPAREKYEHARGFYPRTATVAVNGFAKLFQLYTTSGNPAAKWITRRTLIPHVGWPYALALAKTAVEECLRDHPECQAVTPYPIGAAPLPSRLVDCSNPDCLRIVEPGPGTGVSGPYIALSYVWGEKAPSYRTTNSNLSSYKVKIDGNILPQTIHDAIHVTRALGVNFLWIDGLCIIQDSEGDKHHELERMRDVYRHAFLTIDAGSAASVSTGFLEDRPIHPEGAAALPFVCPRLPGGRIDRLARDVNIGMVYWVHLAPFGHYPMSYFTESDSLCPRDGKPTAHTAQRGGAHHDDSNDVPRLPDAVFHPNRHIARGSDEWNNIHGRWLRIVEDYSSRKLSDPSDKLTAISALAEMFAPVLGPDYAAGLWRHTLLEDLLWESQSSGLAPPRPGSSHSPGYRAPSWSWASTDGAVRFWHNTTGVPLAEVVECTLLLRNKQLPFGPVVSGSLVLYASLLRCRRIGRHGIEIEAEIPSHPSLAPKRFACTANFCYEDDDAVREIWIVPIMQVGIFYNTMQGLVVTRKQVDAWVGAGGAKQKYRNDEGTAVPARPSVQEEVVQAEDAFPENNGYALGVKRLAPFARPRPRPRPRLRLRRGRRRQQRPLAFASMDDSTPPPPSAPADPSPPPPPTTSGSPTDFLKGVVGKRVVVRLTSGVDYRGILSCLDGYMNIALEQTEEHVNGRVTNQYGDAFIRGNNVLYISAAEAL
ncbi:heterokaryon incompatibility protein-domain-containing protein [Cubamyces lactineus]|nr:heterokaryon incompatibility protein-domain-containing protein [Cubamyces lactineus]